MKKKQTTFASLADEVGAADPEIVYIEWLDAAGGSGWNTEDDAHIVPIKVRTYGYLVKETDDAITVSCCFFPQVSDPTQNVFGPYITIPLGMVQLRETIQL